MKTFVDQMHAMDGRRDAARITSAELAAEAGASEVSLSRWRNGKQQPTVDDWSNVLRALDRLIERRAEELRNMGKS